MLQVTDAPGATVGHPGALGRWRPRVGSKGWLRAGLWGAGHSHTPVSTHHFLGEALLFGRGVGVSPAWGGASSPVLSPAGQSHQEEGLKARLVGMEGGWAQHEERDIFDLGLCTRPRGGGSWPVDSRCKSGL